VVARALPRPIARTDTVVSSAARPRRRPTTRLALVFVAIPLVVFGLPAAFGLPWLTGDNLIQNFPLRGLVGADLRAGHLPLWDPYIWSGAPLLAGFNAGAAYPLTWLFAVLPHVLAWVTGQVAVEVVAALGVLTLLRFQGRSFTAAALGSAAFSYGGFVAMQVVHIDLVEAAGWLVWAFVALDRIGHRPAGRPVLPWVALLGLSLGLMVLTGAAEPILDGGVALALFALWLVWRCGGRRFEIVASVVGGVVLGALVGAAQLLPGNALQSQSQRAAHTYWYFTSGSMNKSLTVLLLDPLLLGGAHSAPLTYVGTYNLAEISGYVGILPVMAALGLLARRHRRHPEAAQWWIWYVIAVVGVVLVWGGFTPVGHLEHLIPLYNRQRLLSRNWMEVDLALVVLFAAWVDHMLLEPRPAPVGVRRHGSHRWSSDVVLPLLPVVAVVVLQVILVAGGPWLLHFMHVPQPVSYGVLWEQGLLLTVPSAIALAAGWLVLRGPRLGRRVGPLVVVVVVADLFFFNAMAQTDPQVGTAVAASGASRALTSTLSAAPPGPGGVPPRFALYDPDRYYSNQANDIGQPDSNLLQRLRTVQGYGALTDARYEAATATHLQGNVSLSALADGTFAGLDLGLLVVPPQYFMTLVVAPPGVAATLPGTVGPTPAATPLPPIAPDRRGPPSPSSVPPTPVANYSLFAPPKRSVALTPGAARTWYFGTTLAVHTITVSVSAQGTSGVARLRVGVLTADGASVHWLAGADGAPAAGVVRVDVPGAPDASGIVIEQPPPSSAALTVEAPVVATAGQGTYRLEGGLSQIVTSPTWRYAGTLDDFGVFEEVPAGAASLVPASAGAARVVSAPDWGNDQIDVHLDRPAVLIRDEAYDSGWQATLSPQPGTEVHSMQLTVVRHGLVQAVSLPAGNYQVRFRYRPHRVTEGLVASAVGVALAAAAALSGLRRARRPRRTDPGARPAAARSARALDGAAPGPVQNAPAERSAAPPPRAP